MPGPMDIKSRHMVRLACYDLDNFREQLFERGLLPDSGLEFEEIEALKSDDIELMKFGIKWVKENVFNINSPK